MFSIKLTAAVVLAAATVADAATAGAAVMSEPDHGQAPARTHTVDVSATDYAFGIDTHGPPGHYAAICFIPDDAAPHASHAAMGMVVPFTVTR